MPPTLAEAVKAEQYSKRNLSPELVYAPRQQKEPVVKTRPRRLENTGRITLSPEGKRAMARKSPGYVPNDLAQVLGTVEIQALRLRILEDLQSGQINVYFLVNKYVKEADDPRYNEFFIKGVVEETIKGLAASLREMPLEYHCMAYTAVIDSSLETCNEISKDTHLKPVERLKALEVASSLSKDRLDFFLNLEAIKGDLVKAEAELKSQVARETEVAWEEKPPANRVIDVIVSTGEKAGQAVKFGVRADGTYGPLN